MCRSVSPKESDLGSPSFVCVEIWFHLCILHGKQEGEQSGRLWTSVRIWSPRGTLQHASLKDISYLKFSSERAGYLNFSCQSYVRISHLYLSRFTDGHDGVAHNVTLDVGDMLLFESHSILHGKEQRVERGAEGADGTATNNSFHFLSS